MKIIVQDFKQIMPFSLAYKDLQLNQKETTFNWNQIGLKEQDDKRQKLHERKHLVCI